MKKTISLIAICACFFMPFATSQTITIDPTVQYQTMSGFGQFGAKRVWWNGGATHDDTWLNNVVDNLGATIHRDEYYPDGGGTYPQNSSDQDADWDEQKPFLIALKNKADNSGEPLKFIVTFWTAPRQWKTNNSHKNGGHLKPENYEDFAVYCAKVVQDYADIGIDLYGISLQNEPRFEEPYNSGICTPDELRDMIKAVGQKFDQEGIDTYIFGPEDMGSYSTNDPWFRSILGDPVSREHLDIWAVHGYTDGVTADLGSALSWTNMYNKCEEYRKPLWMTETSGFNDVWDEGVFDMAASMFLALEYGNVSGWVFWIGTLINNGTPLKKFYAAKQYYRFIRPGAVHIESSSSDIDVKVTSFKHAEEGRITSVILNNSTSTKTISLNFANSTAPSSYKVYQSSATQNCEDLGTVSNNSVELPAKSVTTIVYESSNTAPSFNTPEDIVILNSAGKQTISLSGIINTEGSQNISVNASSSNTSIIPNPSVIYSSPANTASIEFTPGSSNQGTITLTIEVSDNGESTADLNVTRKEIQVKVLPFINKAPTLDAITDITCYLDDGGKMIEFTGLTDGNDGSQEITVTAVSEESILVDVDAFVNGNKVQFFFEPFYSAKVPITLTLKDDGGTDLNGIDTKIIEFNLDILKGSNPNPEPEPTSINSTNSVLNVFPNPTSNMLTISLQDRVIENIQVLTLSGCLIKESSNINQPIINYNMSNLTNGMYLIKISDGINTYTSKIVKQ